MSFDQALERAWDYLEQGDVKRSRRCGADLEAEAPGHPEVLLLLAACDREEGQIDQAIDRLKRAADADPEWATPELWLAEILGTERQKLAEALEHAGRAVALAEEEDEYCEAVAIKAGLEIDLHKLTAARKTLAELPPAGSVSLAPAWALEFAHLCLGAGEIAAARRRFETLVEQDAESADAWHGIGLCAEVMGDEENKRAAWVRTLALDDATPLDRERLSEAEMAEVAEEALAELPERARTLIQNVPILIADLPSKADVERGLDPRLLGMFEGTSLPEASSLGNPPLLTQILLFRKNLERLTTDAGDLREQIRITLLHETGHFFGMSEEDLEEVGLD